MVLDRFVRLSCVGALATLALSALSCSSGGAGGSTGGGLCTTSPTSVIGTWDLIGTAPGLASQAGVLVFGQNSVSITFGTTTLAYTSPSGPTTWTDPNSDTSPVAFTTTSNGQAINLGILPFTVGGIWSFATPNGEQCQGSLTSTALSAACVGADDLPDPLPSSIDGDFAGAKGATAASIFGDLGGTWSVGNTGNVSAAHGCSATFSGNTISIVCTDADLLTGSASASVCDGAISGTVSNGIEFSGRRR